MSNHHGPSPAPAERDRRDLVRQAELIISNVLRIGVLTSAGVIALGTLLYYLQHRGAASFGLKSHDFPHSLAAVGAGVLHLDPLAIVAFGLLILLATPFFRVAVSIVAFAIEGDHLYTGITAIVLLILIISFLLGRGGA